MNGLEKILFTSLTYSLSAIPSIKTNKIHSVAMTIFPWIVGVAIIGLVLHSEISRANQEKKDEARNNELSKRAQKKNEERTKHLDEKFRRQKKDTEALAAFRETLNLIKRTPDVDTVIQTINSMPLLHTPLGGIISYTLRQKIIGSFTRFEGLFWKKKICTP